MGIDWQINPGPMLISYVWFQADGNKDGIVTEEEARKWAAAPASLFTAALDHERLPLRLDGVKFPSDMSAFLSGAESIVLHLSAAWSEPLGDSYELVLYNGLEESRSVNWYYLIAQDDLKFPTPQQSSNLITLEVFEPSAQASARFHLWTEWDSSIPSLPQEPPDTATQTPAQTRPGLSDFVSQEQNPSQQILVDLVRGQEISIPFYLFALGVSLALGALHALTPGHGKTVVAAYLVGSRGTSWHAFALGTVVTLTHTGSVFLLGILTLVASQYILPTTLIPVLEMISGLLILGLGFHLLRERYRYWRNTRVPEPGKLSRRFSLKPFTGTIPTGVHQIHKVHSGHNHPHDHGSGHIHSHDIPEAVTWRSLIALGISGGLVPCPDAIAILLVAIAINRILLGLALIISFSLGLALVVIVIGLLLVNSRWLFTRISAFERVSPVLPMASAFIVLALGLALTVGAYLRWSEAFILAGPGAGSMEEAQVLYLSGGQEQVRRLFISKLRDGSPVLLSGESENVVDYVPSPDQTKVLYVTQTRNFQDTIWLVDLHSRGRRVLVDCAQAICSRPAWSPDGKFVVYEYMRFAGKNAYQVISLWWLDVDSGETNPLFQESKLYGIDPRWSPDGKWLGYAAAGVLRLYNLQSGEGREINSVLAAIVDWAPDSRSFLFKDVILQYGQFVTQIFAYDLRSRQTRNISPGAGYENISAAWSPDGVWIAMVRRGLSMPPGDQISLMRADGSEARPLTDLPGRLHSRLSWFPDGTHLLFNVKFLDSSSSESFLQTIEVGTGRMTDPGIKGYDAVWVFP